MFRRSRPGDAPLDPMDELGSRWRYPMRRIGDAVARIRALEDRGVTASPDSPTSEQLSTLARQAEAAWESAWTVASEATHREEGLTNIDPTRVAADLEEARRRLADVPDGSVDSVRAAAEVNTRESQFRAVHEVWNLVDDADAQLRSIAAALEDAAARVSGLGEATAADVAEAAAGLTTVNGELDALRTSVTQIDDHAG